MSIEDIGTGKAQLIYAEERTEIDAASTSLLKFVDHRIDAIRSTKAQTDFLEFVNRLHGFLDTNDVYR